MVTDASTYLLVAGPDPPGPALAEVERLTVTPPMVTDAVALAVKVATLVLLMVRVQVAVLPLTEGDEHVVLCDVGAGLTLGTMRSEERRVGLAGRAVTTVEKL